MTTEPTSLSTLVQLMFKEGKRRLLTVAVMFSVVALVGLNVALLLPKRYEASTLILVEANNIIKPLMEGRAVPTSVADQTAVVNQIVLGRRVLRELLQFGGWVKPPPARQPDPREEERLLNRLKAHIKIDITRDEMVHLSFTDSDPKRTFMMANKLAEIYLRESDAGKERESREAFDFIDKQVKEYGDKLSEIHEKVLARYRGDAPKSAGPDGEPVPVPVVAHAPKTKISAEELAALRTEEALLQTQVSRKAQAQRDDPRAEEQAHARVMQLQNDLDRLSATYTDEHPDVKRTKRELERAQAELARIQEQAADRDASAQLASKLDDDVARAARSRLDEIQRRIAAATGVPVRHAGSTSGDSQLMHRPTVETIDPDMRLVGRDTTLSELLRRYEATRDIYQDLLKRRENARVSMELDAEHSGFTMRIQEAAELPASATGLRLMHLSLIGLILATLVPLGFLFLLVRFDRRVRSTHQIDRLVPLLGTISYAPGHREKSRLRSREVAAVLMVVGVFAVYLITFLIKLKTT